MTAIKADARGVVFEIESSTPDTWLTIGATAINTFTKSTSYQTTDTTTYGSEGQHEEQNMEIAKTLQLEGFRLIDPDTGDLDAGQARVEALAELLSDDSVGSIRFAHEAETDWEVWNATAQLGDTGGGNNDKVSWSVTFTRTGASTTAAKS